MSIPFGADTVTLIQRMESRGEDGRTQVRFARHILKGCSWRHTERRTRYNETLEHGTEITCRIPVNNPYPRPGDYLFLGAIEQDFTSAAELSEALALYRDTGAFIVTSVKDNARPGTPLPHWAAKGEA